MFPTSAFTVKSHLARHFLLKQNQNQKETRCLFVFLMEKKVSLYLTCKQILQKKRDSSLSVASHDVHTENHEPVKQQHTRRKPAKVRSREPKQDAHSYSRKCFLKSNLSHWPFSWAPCRHPIKSFSTGRTAQILRHPSTDLAKASFSSKK